MATLTTSYQLIAETTLGNTGYGDVIVRMYAKYNSQSIANNTSNISVQCRIQTYGGYWWSSSGTSYSIGIGSNSTGGISCNGQYNVGETTLGTYTKDIEHNANGALDVAIAVNFTSQPWGWSQTPYAVVSLPTIPRYANITSFTVNKRDETSVSVGYTADAVCDWARYSLDNTNWHDLPNNGVISGLSANTKYTFYLALRRKDSQLWSYSGGVSQTTYDYPHCIESPDFTIGNPLVLKFYNPLGRSIKIYVIGYNGTEMGGDTITGTTISGYINQDWLNWWYSTIPSSTYGKYAVKVIYGSITKIRDNGNKYYINPNNCKPTFNDFDYSTNLSELTGNNNTIINGKTTTTMTIPIAKKATGFQGSWITKYRFECGNQKLELDETSNELVSTFYACNSATLKVTAIDSRGQEKPITKTIANFKNYVMPTFETVKIERKNGVDIETNLDATINFWQEDFGNGANKITGAYYRTKKRTDNDYGEWNSINLESILASENVAIIEDFLIHANGQNGGFEIGVAYDVQVQVSDGLDNYILSSVISGAIPVTDGKVGFSALKDNEGNYHIGLDGMPNLKAPLALKNKVPFVNVDFYEPTTGEEVWIQKSKNLFDIEDSHIAFMVRNGNEISFSGTYYYGEIKYFYDFEINRPYTVSFRVTEASVSTMATIMFFYKDGTYSENYAWDVKVGNYSIPLTPVKEVNYAELRFFRLNNNTTQRTGKVTDIQIEEGEIATSYEPYTGNKMYTKNKYGGYDIFYDGESVEQRIKENTNSINTVSNNLAGAFRSLGYTTIDEFRKWIVNNAPVGVFLVYLNINGGISACVVMKASNNYLSYIRFSYSLSLEQARYANGTWY